MAAGSAAALWADFRKTYQKILKCKDLAAVVLTRDSIESLALIGKVEMILKRSLDSIPSSSPSVKIQIMVNKLLKT